MEDMNDCCVEFGATFALDEILVYLETLWTQVLQLEKHRVHIVKRVLGYGEVWKRVQRSQSQTMAATSPHASLQVIYFRLQDLLYLHPELRPSGIIEMTPCLQKHYQTQWRSWLDYLKRESNSSGSSSGNHRTLLIWCPSSLEMQKQSNWLAWEQKCREEVVEQVTSCTLVTFHEMFQAYPDLANDFEDPEMDVRMHAPFTDAMNMVLALFTLRQLIKCLQLRLGWNELRKVIVLDCDQTLWNGVVGEVGIAGLSISPSLHVLQTFMLEQYHRGMLLCLCSKNAHEDVYEVFEPPKIIKSTSQPKSNLEGSKTDDLLMPLTWSHFVATKINWQDKALNLRELAHELNLGLDAFIFVDDNLTECMNMRIQCPDVHVLHIPSTCDASKMEAFLRSSWAFDLSARCKAQNMPTNKTRTQTWLESATVEDSSRTKWYQVNAMRQTYEKSFDSYEAFVQSLSIHVDIQPLPICFDGNNGAILCPTLAHERMFQLLDRTNQFNATTNRLTSAEIHRMFQAHPDLQIHAVHVTDRFGYYGFVGLMFHYCWPVEEKLNPPPSLAVQGMPFSKSTKKRWRLHVPIFLLSCRVLNRGVEHEMMRFLGRFATSLNAFQVCIEWRETAKNIPVTLFLQALPKAHLIQHSFNSLKDQRDQQYYWCIPTAHAQELVFRSSTFLHSHSQSPSKRAFSAIFLFNLGSAMAYLWNIFLHWCTCFPWSLSKENRKEASMSSKHPLRMLEEMYCLEGLVKVMRSLRATHFPEHFKNETRSTQHFQTLVDSLRRPYEGIMLDENENITLDHQRCKFRRKVRHQTKLLLHADEVSTHSHAASKEIIWSATGKHHYTNANLSLNRLHLDSTETTSKLTMQMHREEHRQMLACCNPVCATLVSLKCSCRHCKACCRKISRLWTRSQSHEHATARSQARSELVSKYAYVLDASGSWAICTVHHGTT